MTEMSKWERRGVFLTDVTGTDTANVNHDGWVCVSESVKGEEGVRWRREWRKEQKRNEESNPPYLLPKMRLVRSHHLLSLALVEPSFLQVQIILNSPLCALVRCNSSCGQSHQNTRYGFHYRPFFSLYSITYCLYTLSTYKTIGLLACSRRRRVLQSHGGRDSAIAGVTSSVCAWSQCPIVSI